MIRSPLLVVGVVIVTFITGLGFGLFLGGGSATPASTSDLKAGNSAAAAANTMAGDRDSSDTLLKFHVHELEQQLEAQKKNQAEAILEDRIDFYNKWPSHLAPNSFSDLKTTDEMADFLKLSPEQRKAVDGHLAQIGAEMKKLVQANLKQTKQDGDSVTYQIAAFPDGKALHEELHKMVESDMGTARGGIFMASAGWAMDQTFYNFGETATTITVKRTDTTGNGPPQYTLQEVYGNGYMMTESIGNQMPARFNGLLQLDPTP